MIMPSIAHPKSVRKAVNVARKLLARAKKLKVVLTAEDIAFDNAISAAAARSLAPYPSLDNPHYLVLLTPDPLAQNEDFKNLNGQVCSSIPPPDRPVRSHEVFLDQADGFENKTACPRRVRARSNASCAKSLGCSGLLL
jgi:hypothetical protein